MVDEVIPFLVFVLGRLQLQCRNLLHSGITLVITCIEKQNLMTSNGKPGCQWSTSRPRANDNIVILNARVAGSVRTTGGSLVVVVNPLMARATGPV